MGLRVREMNEMKIYENGVWRKATYEEKQQLKMIADENMHVHTRIEQLKAMLADTDYIACKIAEGVARKEEYADELKGRQEMRDEINRLMSEVTINDREYDRACNSLS